MIWNKIVVIAAYFVNILKNTKLYTLKESVLQYINKNYTQKEMDKNMIYLILHLNLAGSRKFIFNLLNVTLCV